jgi:hypothetical protein
MRAKKVKRNRDIVLGVWKGQEEIFFYLKKSTDTTYGRLGT